EEVGARLEPDEALVATHQLVAGAVRAVPRAKHERGRRDLPFHLLRALRCSCRTHGHRFLPSSSCRLGRSEGNSHPQVEEEASSILQALQPSCASSIVIRTHVRTACGWPENGTKSTRSRH